MLGRRVADRATKQGGSIRPAPGAAEAVGWWGRGRRDLMLTGVQGSHLEMLCLLAAPD